MSKIKFPSQFARFLNNQTSIDIPPGNLQKSFDDIYLNHPQLKEVMLDEQGEFTSFIIVFFGDKQISAHELSDITLEDNDEIHVIQAIAGG